jgi:hypothetical protein
MNSGSFSIKIVNATTANVSNLNALAIFERLDPEMPSVFDVAPGGEQLLTGYHPEMHSVHERVQAEVERVGAVYGITGAEDCVYFDMV